MTNPTAVRAHATRRPIVILICLGTLLILALTAPSHAAARSDATWKWRPQINAAAARHHVPAGMIQAIMAVESGGNPHAHNASGADGLMQLIPMWGTRLSPEANIAKGAEVLKRCINQAGGVTDAAIGCYYTDHPSTAPSHYIHKVRSAWAAIAAQGG